MHIAEVLHDLIEHSPAYLSETNREDAHQAVDNEYPDHVPEADPAVAAAAEADRKARIADLKAQLAELDAAAIEPPGPGPADG